MRTTITRCGGVWSLSLLRGLVIAAAGIGLLAGGIRGNSGVGSSDSSGGSPPGQLIKPGVAGIYGEPMPDLLLLSVDASGLTGAWQTLEIHGQVSAEIGNLADTPAVDPFMITFFEDADHNAQLDVGTDNVLGSTVRNGLLAGETATVTAAVSGTVLFRDNLIYAFVDSDQIIQETDETNNYFNTGLACRLEPQLRPFNPVLKWSWTQSSVPGFTDYLNVMSTPGIIDLTGDGVPDVVFGSTASRGGGYVEVGVLRALDGRDGSEIFTITDGTLRVNTASSVAVGDIELDGLPEIIACDASGAMLLCFEHDGTFKWRSPALEGIYWGAPSLADLDADGIPEIVIGRQVLNADGTLRWSGNGGRGVSAGPISLVADVDLDGMPDIVAGNTVYNADGSIKWMNAILPDGLNAVANFDSDAFAEIVLVSGGTVRLLEHDGSVRWGPVAIPGGGSGGPPTVADYDGDGELEIGVAGAARYAVFETDGTLKWAAVTQDASSNATGSSVFDFEGDGAAEVVYRDELKLRAYRGSDGSILFETPMSSCTWHEYVLVADVDADGSAEIVAVANDNCGYGVQRGVYVLKDAEDGWVPTRRIWNQHTYHITNINDDGSIPVVERNNWLYPPGHPYNNYRQNVLTGNQPLMMPDLTASFVRTSRVGAAFEITARIGNGGALLVGEGVPVSFYDGDPAAGGILLGTTSTIRPLEPGCFEDVTLELAPGTTTAGTIWVAADDAGGLESRNRECDEVNNIHDSGLRLAECVVDGDCEDGNECVMDSCIDGVCVHAPATLGAPCGDPSDVECDRPDTCDGAGTCTDNVDPEGAVCRPVAGLCDVPETCDGSSRECPDDSFVPAGMECRAVAGSCDAAESCTGDSPNCAPDAYEPPGTLCRPAAGECDAAERCSGLDPQCPPDGPAPSGAPCGDPLETACDHADTCDGQGSCLGNIEPDGTSCSDGWFCNGEETCRSGECIPGPAPCIDVRHCDETRDLCLACVHDAECDDGDACTDDACVNNVCVHSPRPNCGLVVYLDIKPGSCPNPVNVGAKGVIPMAILGSEDVDVAAIDPTSIVLTRADGVGGAVAPLRESGFEDVATPFTGVLCDCHELTQDGFVDLSLKFSTQEVARELELGALPNDSLVKLTIVGRFLDGTPFATSDCVRTVPVRNVRSR